MPSIDATGIPLRGLVTPVTDSPCLPHKIEYLLERMPCIVAQSDVVARVLDDELLEVRRIGIERALCRTGRRIGQKQQIVIADDLEYRDRDSSRAGRIESEPKVQFSRGPRIDVRRVPGKDFGRGILNIVEKIPVLEGQVPRGPPGRRLKAADEFTGPGHVDCVSEAREDQRIGITILAGLGLHDGCPRE
jgi:hypothetical protein